MTERPTLDVVLSQTLRDDPEVAEILRTQLAPKYDLRESAYLRESAEPETLIYLAFVFSLAQVFGPFLNGLGKDLYAATKGIFQRKPEREKPLTSTRSFFHAHVRVADVEVKLTFQTDAYLEADSFGSMFAQVMTCARDMVKRDPRIQQCKEVHYEWNDVEQRPIPWQAVPRGFPSETRTYYSWNGEDWEVLDLEPDE